MGLVYKVLGGDVQAAARLISHIEDEAPEAPEEMEAIYPHTGKAHIVGVTGPPGAGKSTLIDDLICIFRKKKMSVGVIAIDPTSALTGGALLGDRVRMQQHCTDPHVFIRSLATRGWVGGLAKAALGAIHVMDAMGKEIIFVETVGSGQVEIDIVKAADTTLVVLTPGTGDEIQMMKAGILESVDIFIVNKADKEGAGLLKMELEMMLMTRSCQPDEWQPGVILTEAVNDKGTRELTKEIQRHREFLISSGELAKRRRERVRLELLETVEGFVRDLTCKTSQSDHLESLVDDLLRGKTNPRRAALKITERLADDLYRLKEKEK